MEKTGRDKQAGTYGTVTFRTDEKTGELIVSFASSNQLVGFKTHEIDTLHAKIAVHRAAQAQGLNLQNILVIH